MTALSGQIIQGTRENNAVASTFGIVPQTLEQALELAKIIADSSFAPKDYRGKPHDVLIAMQMGAEVGLKPMQAIQNIAVINGRPCLWGDALLAVVRVHKDFDWIQETDDGSKATCVIKREGSPEHTTTFSIDDAKKANLAGKAGPWTQSPKRMRQLRARAFCCRDTFPDALKGLDSAEVVSDYEKIERDVTPRVMSEKLSSLIDVIDSTDSAKEQKDSVDITSEDILTKIRLSKNKGELVSLLPSLMSLSDSDKDKVRSDYREKMSSFVKEQD